MTHVLLQADDRWGREKLGLGPSTIGKGGCLLTCLCLAARELGTAPGITPPQANKKFITAGAFKGDGLVIHTAAPAVGLEAPLAERVAIDGEKPATQEGILTAVFGALARGFAILHVDHDALRPGGDVTGDHFVLAHARVGNELQCFDPAVGRVALKTPALQGIAVWGKGDVRTYTVRGVRPVRRMPT